MCYGFVVVGLMMMMMHAGSFSDLSLSSQNPFVTPAPTQYLIPLSLSLPLTVTHTQTQTQTQ